MSKMNYLTIITEYNFKNKSKSLLPERSYDSEIKWHAYIFLIIVFTVLQKKVLRFNEVMERCQAEQPFEDFCIVLNNSIETIGFHILVNEYVIIVAPAIPSF